MDETRKFQKKRVCRGCRAVNDWERNSVQSAAPISRRPASNLPMTIRSCAMARMARQRGGSLAAARTNDRNLLRKTHF